jgi:hypothetical protein
MTAIHPGIVTALNHAITAYGATKEQAISLVITSLVETGIPLKTAFNAIFGGGAYSELAADVWETLQAA